MKKLVSLLLTLAIVLSCVSMVNFTVVAEAQDITPYLTYEISNGEVTITDCNYSISGNFYIPEYIDGYPVTSIAEFAFDCCENLLSIDISNNITVIGEGAFLSCRKLTVINIPDNVSNIAFDAFGYCTSIEKVTVSNNNVKYYSSGNCIIDKNAKEVIFGCKNSIIPNDITAIGPCAFNGISSLTTIIIPSNITSIGYSAFEGCSSLNTVYYAGTQKQWNSISIGNNNSNLKNANIIYNYGVATPTPTSTPTPTPTPIPENAPCIEIETVEAKTGKTVQVKVSLKDNPGIWGIDLRVVYDKTQLTLTNVINGEIFDEGEWTKGNVSGERYVLSYAANGFENINTDGVLAIFEFTVNENATEDVLTEITAFYNEGDIIDADFNDISAKIVNGGINVISVLYGDLNGDGLVNKKDDLTLRMHLAELSVEIDLDAADVFLDGTVNKKDLLLLKQFLAGWSVQLGK